MDREDPEKRVAELERRLADAQRPVSRTARSEAVDDHAHRFAQALRDTLHDGGPPPARVAQLREESIRVAVDAGLSQQQYNDVLKRAGLPLLAGGAVPYTPGRLETPIDRDAVVRQALLIKGLGMTGQPGFPGRPPRRRRSRAERVGLIGGLIGGGFGLCCGVVAALITALPASTLWLSPIVCGSPYRLTYETSGYSYEPGQSGTTVDYLCTGPADSYGVNPLMIFGMQLLPVVLAVCAVAAVVWRVRRGRR